MPDPQHTRPAAVWIYDGIFGPLSALPADFVPASRVKPARNYDELEPWVFDTAFPPRW